jgi:hypothetical protein
VYRWPFPIVHAIARLAVVIVTCDKVARPGTRPSISSSLLSVMNQEAGTKLTQPIFGVKSTKTIDGVKKEFIRDSDSLDYFDDYEHYI